MVKSFAMLVNGGAQTFVIPLSQASVSGGFYLALFSALLATQARNEGIGCFVFVSASQCDHLVPICASVIGMTCRGEALHWYHAFGFIFVLAGLVIANIANHRGEAMIKKSPGLFKN